MRIVLFLVILLGVITLYLNRSYATYYNNLRKANLKSPYTKNTFLVDNPNSVGRADRKTTLKYVALGDSLTAGVGSKDYRQTFPYIFANSLLSDSFEVTFINLGRAGVESGDVLKYQLPRAVEENPDYVTVLVGINDIHNLRSTNQYKNNMSQILSALHSRTHAKVYVLNIPLLGYQSFPIPYNYLLDLRTQQFNNTLMNLPEIKYVKLIDLYDRSKEEFLLHPEYYSIDSFHPNEKGYKFWGDLVNAD